MYKCVTMCPCCACVHEWKCFWVWTKPTCDNVCSKHICAWLCASVCTYIDVCVCVCAHSCSAGSYLPGWRQSPEGLGADPLLCWADVAVQMQRCRAEPPCGQRAKHSSETKTTQIFLQWFSWCEPQLWPFSVEFTRSLVDNVGTPQCGFLPWSKDVHVKITGN